MRIFNSGIYIAAIGAAIATISGSAFGNTNAIYSLWLLAFIFAGAWIVFMVASGKNDRLNRKDAIALMLISTLGIAGSLIVHLG